MLLNCGVGEDTRESFGLQEIKPVLKEVSPEYSLEGLMLKMKLWYFGHLMQRTDSFEKTLMMGKIEDGRKGQQRMRWLDDIANSMDMNLSKVLGWWWTGRPGILQSMVSQRVNHDWATEVNWTEVKEANLRRLHNVWFQLCDILEKAKLLRH